MKKKFPQFDSYVCVGDSISWEKDGFELTARIEFDEDTKPTDFDCYSQRKINEWKNDEWFFCVVVLSITKNGVMLDENVTCLGGVDCNYNKRSNRYLATVAKELEEEAISEAKRIIEKINA